MEAVMLPARRDALIDPRALGAAIACIVALVSAVVTGAGYMGMDLPPEGVGVVSVVAAGTGGWLLGPRAARATRVIDWVGITFALAFLTMVLGAVGVALLAAFSGPSTAHSGPTELLFGIVALSLLGMLFFGWVAVPILIVPSAIWAVVMWIAVGRR